MLITGDGNSGHTSTAIGRDPTGAHQAFDAATGVSSLSQFKFFLARIVAIPPQHLQGNSRGRAPPVRRRISQGRSSEYSGNRFYAWLHRCRQFSQSVQAVGGGCALGVSVVGFWLGLISPATDFADGIRSKIGDYANALMPDLTLHVRNLLNAFKHVQTTPQPRPRICPISASFRHLHLRPSNCV